jgi:hypothetical protein
MRCQRCGNQIGPLRLLSDREFCCPEHRSRGAMPTASAMRDLESECDPLWLEEGGQPKKGEPHSASGAAGILIVLSVALLVASRLAPESAPAKPAPASPPPAGYSISPPEPGAVVAFLERFLPGEVPVRASDDFLAGLAAWTGPAEKAPTWTGGDGTIRPGGLKLWQPTLHAADYDFHFLGQIEKRAISWAFRARDTQNYYAAKLLLFQSGQHSGVSLVRYAVLGAKQLDRVQLPLPITMFRERPYQITVAVRGGRFSTLIDGHLIDEWHDARLASGGVGLFAEPGESSAIHWVRFAEHKGWATRLFASFLLFAPPGVR